ncbi:MAG: ThiF family adenylyltransferase, partial [Cytophagales bacterium]|nr:ThiF family adenylyltransferase [Cytophaga sp.]
MNDEIIALIESKKRKSAGDNVHKPLFFRIYNQPEKELFEHALEHTPGIHFHDEITSQLRELIRSLNPSVSFSEEIYSQYIQKHLNEVSVHEYGVWVYYPWSNRMVHTLDEQEFIQVRTNRNTYKITPEERDLLASKKVGVVGLSVGQSVALTMAMERCCGELRLADFDALELTNLNRIRTPIYNLGVNKAVSVAREIAEIDPYIKTVVFD